MTTNGVKRVITDLSPQLSSSAKIVTEKGDQWRVLMERWTDLGKQNPAAIICVATEGDIQEAVREIKTRNLERKEF